MIVISGQTVSKPALSRNRGYADYGETAFWSRLFSLRTECLQLLPTTYSTHLDSEPIRLINLCLCSISMWSHAK